METMERYRQARAQVMARRLDQAIVDLAVARDALGVVQGALERVRETLPATLPGESGDDVVTTRLDREVWPGLGEATASLQRARDHLAIVAAFADPEHWPTE